MTASIRIFAIVLFLITVLGSSAEAKNTKHKDVNAGAFKRQIAKTQVIILDVRTPDEYNSEHLENAKMINFKSDNFSDNIAKLPKDITICVYCRSGNRSSKSMKILKEKGFLKVYNLKGGIKAWQAKGLKTIQ